MPAADPLRDDLLAAAEAAVDAAVAVLRACRGAPLERVAKGARDFATQVDMEAEAALRAVLGQRTPKAGFFGEEGGGDPLERGRVWVADPLDGTINYATGSPLCGVMLALLEDGEPVLSVVDLPFLGERLTARAGAGAWCAGRRLRVRDRPGLGESIVALGDGFHSGGGPRFDAYLELNLSLNRRCLRFRSVGSAAVLWAWLARGHLQAFALAHNHPHDVLPGRLVAAEAGALVLDYDGSPSGLGARGTLAVVPSLRDELVALAAPLAAVA